MNALEAARDKLARRGLLSAAAFIPGLAFFHIEASPSLMPLTLGMVALAVGAGWQPWWPQARRWAFPLVFGFYAIALGLPMMGFITGTMGACVLACTLTTLLFGARAGAATTATMVAVILGFGWLHYRGAYEVVPGVADLARADNWGRTGVALAILGVLPLQGMFVFLREIAETARSRVAALTELEREYARHEAAEQTRRQAQEDARRAQRQKTIGRLGGGLAHEINGALQEIGGWLEVLERALPADHDFGREAHSQMSVSAERAAAIGRRLLLLGGSHVARKERTDLGVFLNGLRGTLAALLGADRELDVAASGNFVTHIDPVELAHVLVNLAANARDAMPDGGLLAIVLREPTPEELADAPDLANAVDVTDTGTGMPPEIVQKIFDPFFSTKGSAGTGLGLASVKHLVEEAGGRVLVRSEVGHGTTFTLLLPGMGPKEASGDDMPPPAGEVSVREGLAAAPLVLFVEDDAGIRRVFERLLTQHGLRLDIAADVDGAIACLRRRTPDLVWTDAVLPGRPTRDLIAELRRVAPDVPVVVCSGHVAEELLRRDLREGGLEFVAKPYAAATLVQRAHQAAARSASTA